MLLEILEIFAIFAQEKAYVLRRKCFKTRLNHDKKQLLKGKIGLQMHIHPFVWICMTIIQH